MKSDSLLNGYISSVSSQLVCSPKLKKAFLSELRADVSAYLSQEENPTREKIECIFGSPEMIASSFISHSDSTEIRKKTSLKKIITVAVIVALIIYLAFVVISLIDVHTEAHGYFEEGIVSASVSIMKGGRI